MESEDGAAIHLSLIAVKGYSRSRNTFLFQTHCAHYTPSSLGRLEKVCLGLSTFPGPMDLSARG